MNEELIAAIRGSWNWAVPNPSRVIAINDFGNIIFQDSDGAFWRICPEELSVVLIAADADELWLVRSESKFVADWSMERQVTVARSKLGAPEQGSVYCLKLPAVLGGQYDISNMGIVKLGELIRISGDLAIQIRDLPDGEKIQIKIID